MSTSLVTLAVVVAAIGFALALAVGEPDQPATLRRSRDRKPARLPAPRTRRSPVARLRSGLALTGLMVVLGAVLAALVAGLAVAVVLGLRRLVA